MATRLQLEVVTPQRQVLRTEAAEVRLPGALGELGVLPGHTPLLTTLAIGQLTVIAEGSTRPLAVFGGFAEVLPDRVTVLAGRAERPEDIDVDAARRERAEAEEALKTASAEELDQVTRKLQMAVTRLQVAGAEH